MTTLTMRVVTTLACLAWLSVCVHASRDNSGTEFIVGFKQNTVTYEVGLEIFATTMSNIPAEVTVTTPLYNPGFSTSATVARQQIELLIVPFTIRVEVNGKENKGVRIVSTQPISVYCVNKEHYTTDAYMALPVHVVGKEYYTVHYIRSPQILLVGIEDSTSFTITLSDNTRASSPTYVAPVSVSVNGQNYGNGGVITSSIDRYETFFVTQYDDYDADFTGSHVISNKPVSLISGNYRCAILSTPPDGTRRSSDQLTEMVPPLDTWGKEFVTTNTPDRDIGDLYRFVASEADTTVVLGGGSLTFTLAQPGDYYEWDQKMGNHMTVTADKPILVAMFSKTWQNDGLHYGDPAMSLLSPINQYSAEYTWSTTNLPSGDPFNDKVSIIVDKTKKNGLRLDGSSISANWESVTGSNKWVQTWLFVTQGSHNIYHLDPSVTFFALASGTEQWNSYAYAAGTRMAQINAPCSPTSPTPGDTIDNDCDGVVDEETLDNIDNDGDGQVDEDLALPPRVDGDWGTWSSWVCSVTCDGSGTKTRTRACDDPAPQNNGEDCHGVDSQSGSCNNNNVPCPVDGGLTSWSNWGSCSATCASGTHSRSRSCTNPSPAHGGAQCVGALSESKTCTTGVSCDVDGGWGTWDSWSSCSVTCATGSQTRARSCDRPARVGNGADCPGDASETQSCTMVACPIDGGWGTWDAWGACSVTCATGSQSRSRVCDRPAPQHLGADCTGSASESQSCTGVVCPVDGGWGTWAAWGSCSVTCATGSHSRTRSCDRPAQAGTGADCVGDNSETQSCTMVPCPIDGGWGTWDAWGACSVTCATGSHSRSRVCDRPVPQHLGADCTGSGSESQSCTMVPCPIDGGWGTWGTWADCTLTCGGIGAFERTRLCDRPPPQYNGSDCPGDALDSLPCDVSALRCPTGNVWEILTFTTAAPAPVDGGFGPWTNWTECTMSCGAGIRYKMRFCNSPKPEGAGQPCQGAFVQEELCNTHACDTGTYAHGAAHGGVCNGRRGLFDCQNGVQCIDIMRKCDCRSDCDDGSDETITYAGCVSNLDQCFSGADTIVPLTPLALMWTVLISLIFQGLLRA